MVQSESACNIVAQLVPDTEAPILGPLLVQELAKRSDCPSFGSFVAGHPECSGCLIQRACESNLAILILTEAQNLTRVDNIAVTANITDLLTGGTTTGPRTPAAVKRTMGRNP